MKEKVELILFISLSVFAVFSAIMMISRRNPITSAIFLILNFFCISGFYLLLKAQFIAIIQVLVYMGAIMVLFLFVIMLLNLQDERKLTEQITYRKITAVLLSVLLAGLIGSTLFFGFFSKNTEISINAPSIGTAENLGKELFTSYSFAVLAAGLLLLAAIVGAVVLAKKKLE